MIRKSNTVNRKLKTMTVTVEDIEKGLRELGLSAGDRVMVHSSLKSFGHVEGGAETVIGGLTRAVGPNGTIVMPTFTLSFFINEPRVLDIEKTHSEVGKITEVFRMRPDTLRSAHMTHSVAAWGKDAAAVAELPSKTAWGEDGTFQWLLDRDAKILMLGVDYNRCTLVHKAEEAMRVPYRKFVTFGGTTIFPDGSRQMNDSQVYVKYSGLDNNWAEVMKAMNVETITQRVMIGESTVRLARARAIYGRAVAMIRENKLALLSEDSRMRFLMIKRER
jgi:aminoglycoside 3-N-acetyltransferase